MEEKNKNGQYQEPEYEIIELNSEDVIITSTPGGTDHGMPWLPMSLNDDKWSDG